MNIIKIDDQDKEALEAVYTKLSTYIIKRKQDKNHKELDLNLPELALLLSILRNVIR